MIGEIGGTTPHPPCCPMFLLSDVLCPPLRRPMFLVQAEGIIMFGPDRLTPPPPAPLCCPMCAV
jgi:hypothetical protein